MTKRDGVEPDASVSPLDGMTSEDAYDWEWRALPRWAKAISLVVGGPAFAVLVWSTFDEEAVSGSTKTICFVLFAAVALMQIYCLNKVISDAKRRRP